MLTSNLTLAPPCATPPTHLSLNKQWALNPLPGGRHELKLWGKFPPRWLANLTSALSARQISVQSGYANKLSPTVWQGTFEILPSADGGVSIHLDFCELAQQESPIADVAKPLLEKVLVEKRNDALFVEVRGNDSVGFLTSMLKLFTYYSLYPAEVSIDTPEGRVLDRFWLKGLGGTIPTDEVCSGLRLELCKYLTV